MKKFFLGVSFLVLSSLSFGRVHSVTKYQVKDINGVTISLVGNKPFTGMVVDGKDREFYIKGKPDGKWLSFYSNGKIKSIENWKNGMLDGKYILYSERGKKMLETYYSNGVDNGKYAVYYDDGKPHIIGQIKNGTPVGKWKVYAKDGRVAAMSKY